VRYKATVVASSLKYHNIVYKTEQECLYTLDLQLFKLKLKLKL